MTRVVWLAIIVAAIGMVGAADVARAKTNPPAVIATMDSQRILRDAKAAQSIAQQIKRYVDQLQEIVKNEESALKSKQTELRQQAQILAPDALDERRNELQQSYSDAQRMVQERRLAIDRIRQEALEVLKAQILEIIEELQKERTFNIVLDRASYSWATAELDITDDIITRLDKRLPSVTVQRPDGF